MSTPPNNFPQSTWWKRLAVRAFFIGFGFAVAFALAVAGYFGYKHHEETKAWMSPLKASFTGADIKQPENEFVMEFQYSIENTTNKDYRFPSGSSIMILLPKGAGYRSGDKAHITWDNDVFIPAKQKVNINIVWTLTAADYTLPPPNDNPKMVRFASQRLIENGGFAIFDERNRYRVDLPEVWTDWPDVKKILDEKAK
jgi:hypothetical protein